MLCSIYVCTMFIIMIAIRQHFFLPACLPGFIFDVIRDVFYCCCRSFHALHFCRFFDFIWRAEEIERFWSARDGCQHFLICSVVVIIYYPSSLAGIQICYSDTTNIWKKNLQKYFLTYYYKVQLFNNTFKLWIICIASLEVESIQLNLILKIEFHLLYNNIIMIDNYWFKVILELKFKSNLI